MEKIVDGRCRTCGTLTTAKYYQLREVRESAAVVEATWHGPYFICGGCQGPALPPYLKPAHVIEKHASAEVYILPITDVKEGDVLVADGGFTCLNNGEVCVVKYDHGSGNDDGGLYVKCREGRHVLSGQIDCQGENYTGFKKG